MVMMLVHIFTLCSLVISVVVGQLVSPCPEVLSYEPINADEPDRWYATIYLKSEEDLEGVWIRIHLDRTADLLGNWFGDTTSSNNREYTIRNPSYRLESGPPIAVRFFVKYNAGSVVPTVNKILLNGKTICPITTRTNGPQLHISHTRSTLAPTQSGNIINQNNVEDNKEDIPITLGAGPTNTGLSVGNPFTDEDDDDNSFFAGDFAGITNNKNASRPIILQPPSPPCGTIASHAIPLIRFGQSTVPGQWPWHVALYYSKGLELVYTCGGTLISEDFVLTAAHCTTKPRTNLAVNVRFLLLYLGKYSLMGFGPEVQDRKAQQIIVHPAYNSTLFYNDIALIKLDRPATITNYVRKCCLWQEPSSSLQNVIGKLGTVVGWGFDQSRQLTNNLMKTKMPVVPTDKCILSNRNFFSQFVSETNYCAGFRNETSVCNGDSGGGMVFPKEGTSGADTVWQIRGIVSVSIPLQGHGTCDPSNYMIFTDVAKHLAWIKRNANL
ncbi:limulus clotting factor C-like isoform X1 [Rhynchophorus ferrugineus]|uniref:limulus clotting factor C-like isoform X1 n=1 Tax=Rhynchophorus ferrugineus TaxID=354439 RepID=UPI003FCD3C9C